MTFPKISMVRQKLAAALFSCLLAMAVSPAFGADEAQKFVPPKGDTPYEKKYYADPFYAEIDDVAKDKSARDTVAFIEMKIQDKPERINAASLWLRDNSLGQRNLNRMDSIYFLSYSDVMLQLARAYQKAGQPDNYADMLKTSLMALYIYEMLATIDAMRCADPTALAAMRQDTLMARYDKFTDAYKLFSKSDFDLFATTAYIADKKFERRKPNEFICGLGAAKLSDMMRQDGTATFNAPNPANGEKSLRVIPPPGYSFTPTYVNDTEWGKRREEMKKRLRKLWADRYERLAPVSSADPADNKADNKKAP